MFDKPKSLAPEPYFTSSLELLYHVTIYVRALTSQPANVTEMHIREINGIMDAIHNIPTSLVEYGVWFTEEKIRESLKRLDTFYEGRSDFRWSKEFDKYLAKARQRNAN